MSRLVSHGDSSSKGDKKPTDVVLIHGVTDDGQGLRVLRARDERVELGQVRPLQEGKPLSGDIVKLKPRPESPFLCDVETELELPEAAKPTFRRASTETQGDGAPEARRKGPARVSSAAYRQNWDAIWSSTKKSELSN